MSETFTGLNKLRKPALAITAIGMLGGLTLTGCSDSSPTEAPKVSPVERYEDEYLGNINDCMLYTAYRTHSNIVPPATVKYDPETKIITITPPSGLDPLQLTGFDQDKHTLEPVGEDSRQIFETYGCEVRKY